MLLRIILASVLSVFAAMSDNTPAAKYRKVMKDVFLSNEISAPTAQRISAASTAAGAAGVADYARAGASGGCSSNTHRDLLKSMMRDCDYPAFYWADIPVWDAKLQATIIVSMPFLLPHECLDALAKNGKLGNAASTQENCPPGVWQHLKKLESILHCKVHDMIALGLHGDGAPTGANASLEQLSWSLPAWQGDGYGPRFVACTILKEFVQTHETFNAIFEVLAWSFKCSATKCWPAARHDGSPWQESDKWRSQQSGELAARGCLCHARGDWKFFKETFNFPAWNAKESMCWLCKANKHNMKDASLSAPWRQQRRTPGHLLHDLRQQGVRPCPLFSVPGFDETCVLVDWLHTMDIGVTADVLGIFFYELSKLLPGATKKLRAECLWTKVQAWYTRHPGALKIPPLTAEMVKGKDKKPKMRGLKASQIKSLVPCAAALAEEFCRGSPRLDTIRCAVLHLDSLYKCLHENQWPKEAAAAAARKLMLLYAALEQEQLVVGNTTFWSMKPKFHLMLELVEYVAPAQGNPRFYWTYADEDFGGWLAKLSARRGGPKNPDSVALKVLKLATALEKLRDLDM